MFFWACKNNDADSVDTDTDSLANNTFYWESYYNDSTGKIEFRKQPSMEKLSVESIISFLNADNANIQLHYVKTSHDTIFVNIPEAMYLTQQMGSTGPMIYLSEVVYNLTQLPDIHAVNFDFEEGDHATPGTYNRNSFDQY